MASIDKNPKTLRKTKAPPTPRLVAYRKFFSAQGNIKCTSILLRRIIDNFESISDQTKYEMFYYLQSQLGNLLALATKEWEAAQEKYPKMPRKERVMIRIDQLPEEVRKELSCIQPSKQSVADSWAGKK